MTSKETRRNKALVRKAKTSCCKKIAIELSNIIEMIEDNVSEKEVVRAINEFMNMEFEITDTGLSFKVGGFKKITPHELKKFGIENGGRLREINMEGTKCKEKHRDAMTKLRGLFKERFDKNFDFRL